MLIFVHSEAIPSTAKFKATYMASNGQDQVLNFIQQLR